MKKMIKFLGIFFKRKTYSTPDQVKNREKMTIIEIAQKVIEEEERTLVLRNELEKKMSQFLNKTSNKPLLL